MAIESAGGRRFARIGGTWLELPLTRKANIHVVAIYSPAAKALSEAVPELEKCFALGRCVVVRIDADLAASAIADDVIGRPIDVDGTEFSPVR